jgi:hypothetical protein
MFCDGSEGNMKVAEEIKKQSINSVPTLIAQFSKNPELVGGQFLDVRLVTHPIGDCSNEEFL